jgi:protein TonB
VKAVKGIGAGCDEEAVRVVNSAPKWKPGKQRGKAVRVRMIIPITFKLG